MNVLCDVCINDSNKTKGAYLIDGDTTNTLSFLCPHCYELSISYSRVCKEKKVAYADEFVKEIMKYEDGDQAIDIIDAITSKWVALNKIVKSLVRVYWGYLAGLTKHPMYKESLRTLIIALVYGVGFPDSDDAIYYPMNMNISTTANNYLFRRSMKKIQRIKMVHEGLDHEVVEGHICEVCLSDNSTFTCRACKAAHYCGIECLIKGALDHAVPCKEIIQVDKEVSLC